MRPFKKRKRFWYNYLNHPDIIIGSEYFNFISYDVSYLIIRIIKITPSTTMHHHTLAFTLCTLELVTRRHVAYRCYWQLWRSEQINSRAAISKNKILFSIGLLQTQKSITMKAYINISNEVTQKRTMFPRRL